MLLVKSWSDNRIPNYIGQSAGFEDCSLLDWWSSLSHIFTIVRYFEIRIPISDKRSQFVSTKLIFNLFYFDAGILTRIPITIAPIKFSELFLWSFSFLLFRHMCVTFWTIRTIPAISANTLFVSFTWRILGCSDNSFPKMAVPWTHEHDWCLFICLDVIDINFMSASFLPRFTTRNEMKRNGFLLLT